MTTAELELATSNNGTLETGAATMKALVYHGPGKRAWENKPRPTIQGIRAMPSYGLPLQRFAEPIFTF